MKISARTRANRLNAKRSTGPRSSSGKARVGRNAIKHGLAAPLSNVIGVDAQIESMAILIAGESDDPIRETLARRIAEAQLDILRVRSAYQSVLAQDEVGSSDDGKTPAAEMAPSEKVGQETPSVGRTEEGAASDFWRELPERSNELLRLDRYESRALSRRRAAIRAFDAYCAGQARRDKNARVKLSQGSPAVAAPQTPGSEFD